MKTDVAQESIDCYHDNEAHFADIKGKILRAMTPGKKYTRREISMICGIEYSCASGRIRELLDDQIIKKCGSDNRGYKNRSVGLICLPVVEGG